MTSAHPEHQDALAWERGDFVNIVGQAMLDAWDEICSDTGCHPLDIEQLGRRRLSFTPQHWARLTAMYIERRAGFLAKRNAEAETT